MAQNKTSKEKKLDDNEQSINETKAIGESHQNGVKKKLKTLTFCRRRKGINDVCQKRKSSWTFKFGPKIRDITKTSVPLNNGESESCVCTVYRRTDQMNSMDSLNFPDVDSLPKCVFNSKASVSSIENLPYENFESSEYNMANEFPKHFLVKPDLNCKTANPGLKESTETVVSFKETASEDEKLSVIGEIDNHVSSSNPEAELTGACSSEIDQFADGVPTNQRGKLFGGVDGFVEALSDDVKPQTSADLYSSDVQSDDEARQIPDEYPGEDWDERARLQRAKEMEEGVEPPPGYKTKQITPQPSPTPIPEHSISELAYYLQNHLRLKTNGNLGVSFEEDKSTLSKSVLEWLQDLTFNGLFNPPVHTRVDYIHCLVPDLLEITSCSCYWGKMDRYEAERLLENKPEGTFLLRDSAQEDFLFSVSFQRYGKTLHARIEQWNHKFSFDSHDPGVFSSPTVCGLIEHYKDPSCCMYFDPMLTIPLHRTFAFSLQHLSRSVICNNMSYDNINSLNLPKSLKFYLKEYHYKQRVKVRRFDC